MSTFVAQYTDCQYDGDGVVLWAELIVIDTENTDEEYENSGRVSVNKQSRDGRIRGFDPAAFATIAPIFQALLAGTVNRTDIADDLGTVTGKEVTTDADDNVIRCTERYSY